MIGSAGARRNPQILTFRGPGRRARASILRLVIGLVIALSVVGLVRVADAGPDQQAGGPRIERTVASADRPSGQLYRAAGPVLSTDGGLLVFWSGAGDLLTDDTNGAIDVFIKDRRSGAIERISVAADGGQGDGPSLNAALSADGRFVAFESRATNLARGDLNRSSDVFVKDRQSGAIERASVSAEGGEGNGGSFRPAMSADGRYVAFWSEASTLVSDDTNRTYDNGGYDVFVKDRLSGAIERLSVPLDRSQGSADSVAPSLSADGRLVAFGSYATNLVSDDTNGVPDIFVKDRETGLVERISVAADGAQASADSFWHPVISADGRFVAFWSAADNLVPDDTNGAIDVFVRDRQTGAVERISVAPDGAQSDGASYSPALSADGQIVAFWSEAANLVAGDANGLADVFVKDRSSGSLERVSVAAGGMPANGLSHSPTLSADGRLVAFWSEAANIVADDTNGRADVFTVDRAEPAGF